MPEVSPAPAPSSPASAPGARLESWKEIAAYLKRDISTVQRWEKKEGLPIHRLPHDKLGSVFAFTAELDAWLNRAIRESEVLESPERQVAVDSSSVAPTPGSTVASDGAAHGRHPMVGVTTALVVMLAGGAAALIWWLARGTQDAHLQPAEIRFVVSAPPLAAQLPRTTGDAPLAISPDGSVLVYVATENEVSRLYQRRLSDAEAVVIAGTEGAQTPFISPDGRWVGFTRFTGTGTGGRLLKVALAGGQPVTICELPAGRGATWGADGTIVFAPHPDAGLWHVPASGGVPRPLTRPDAGKGERSHRWPFFVPGRRLVLYSIAKSDITTFDDAVIAMRNLDTGQDTELIRGGSYPIYLETTEQLLFARAGTVLAASLDVRRSSIRDQPVTVLTDVMTYPVTGAAAVAISNTGVLATASGGSLPPPANTVVKVDRQGNSEPIPFPPGPMSGVRLAQDQRTVAMEMDGANATIWIGDLRDATLTRLTPQWTHWSPVWSPDGKQVAFTSGRGGGRAVFVQRIDHAQEAERLTTTEGTHLVTSWSRDGRFIAYDDQTSTTARDIVLLDVQTRTSVPVIHSPADEYSGRFSPDGHYLAYVSNESGVPEIYLHALQQSSLKIPVSRGEGGTNPVWALDGRELFYRDGDAMMAVSVQTRPSLAVSVPHVLFRKRTLNNDFDVTADGGFVMVEASSGTVLTPFTVTVNWSATRPRDTR
jgi:serine/threonine-protein kinase